MTISPRTFVGLLLITIIPLFIVNKAFTQKFINLKTYNADSLLLILPDQKAEERVNTLNKLAVSLSFIDFEMSKAYADQAMDISIELHYQEGEADAFRNYGHIYFSQGNYPVALNNYHEALSRYEALGNRHTMAWVCYDLAKIHYCVNNLDKTIEYGDLALSIFREPLKGNLKVGNVRDTISMIEGLALAYEIIGEYDRSLDLYEQAIEIGQENNFDMTEMLIMTLKAGEVYSYLGDADNAKSYFDKALNYPDVNPDIQALKYRPMAGLGDFHYLDGEIDSAIFYKQKAFDWYNDQGYLYWALNLSNQLGNIYYSTNDLNAAETHFRQSEEIFKEIVSLNSLYRSDSLENTVNLGIELFFPHPQQQLKELTWVLVKWMYARLYQISKRKKSDEVLNYHIAYFNATDTLNKLLRSRETLEIQTKYESERKDQQIETLSLENELKEFRLDQTRYFFMGSVAFLILMLLLVLILFRQKKLKTDQGLLSLQQKFFRTQMNPHFVFNSLASIQNFVVKQDAKKASIYLSKFSELVRSILDSSTEEYIPFEKEVKTIENYLELQKLRFPDKFDYFIDVDDNIDLEELFIPPMLAQPVIENSIEHGFKHKKTKGIINIRFSLQNNIVIYEVEDDGVGRKKAREIMLKQNKDHKSLATAITYERIQVLNKKLKEKIKFEVIDLIDDQGNASGTKVIFKIPLKRVY